MQCIVGLAIGAALVGAFARWRARVTQAVRFEAEG